MAIAFTAAVEVQRMVMLNKVNHKTYFVETYQVVVSKQEYLIDQVSFPSGFEGSLPFGNKVQSCLSLDQRGDRNIWLRDF